MARNKVCYEWDIEFVDQHGDILDHNHCDTLKGIRDELQDVNGTTHHLVLVRDEGNEDEGLLERSWAYAKRDGAWWRLPEEFDCGSKVPKRFHKELDHYR